MDFENTSGKGRLAVVPLEVKKWSWGAFLLGGIWGLGNGTYVSFLVYVPTVVEILPLFGYKLPTSLLVLAYGLQISMLAVLGRKGNQWAWRNKQWPSLEHFKRAQQKWAIGGVGVICLVIGVEILAWHLKLYSYLQPTIQEKPPSVALREAIQQHLNKEFWPEEYNASEAGKLAGLGFGTAYALNYVIQWSKQNAYFQIFVGYDKQSRRRIGYEFEISVKGTNPPGIEMARTYLRDLPMEGWVQDDVGSKYFGETAQISSAVWKETATNAKFYAHVVASVDYKKPRTDIFPGEAVADFTEIRLGIDMPNSPYYSRVEKIRAANQPSLSQ